jgi:hypothetical protein
VLHVVLADDHVHQLAQVVARALERGLEMLVPRGRRERGPDATPPQLLEQRPCPVEHLELSLARQLQVDRLRRLAQRLAILLLRLRTEHVGQEVVAPLADLRPDPVRVHLVAVLRERAHPGLDVRGIGVDEGPVEVEENGRQHRGGWGRADETGRNGGSGTAGGTHVRVPP